MVIRKGASKRRKKGGKDMLRNIDGRIYVNTDGRNGVAIRRKVVSAVGDSERMLGGFAASRGLILLCLLRL